MFIEFLLHMRALSHMRSMGYVYRSRDIGPMPLCLSQAGMDAYAQGWDDADIEIRLVS